MTIENVSKSFEGCKVLDGFSLIIQPGETLCLMGASGAGKTTLIHIVLGLLAPDAGKLSGFEGLRTAAVFQEDRLIEGMSALQNVLLVAPHGESPESAKSLLRALGLGDKTNERVSQMSGGERRRVALARALYHHPDLLILDEPFKGLDDQTRRQAAALIRARLPQATVILVTHDSQEAALLNSTRIVKLNSAPASHAVSSPPQ